MKKRNVFKRIETKRHLIPVLLVIAVLLSGMCVLPGCSLKGINNTKKEEIDYTVVEDEYLPAELKKLIDEKKGSTLKMTYTTKDYTYMVAGYGTMTTSGYSISVNDVYLGENSIYVDLSLAGPKTQEPVTQRATTPYIVLKTEKREEPVVFKM